jgi:hypothetical protein
LVVVAVVALQELEGLEVEHQDLLKEVLLGMEQIIPEVVEVQVQEVLRQIAEMVVMVVQE